MSRLSLGTAHGQYGKFCKINDPLAYWNQKLHLVFSFPGDVAATVMYLENVDSFHSF